MLIDGGDRWIEEGKNTQSQEEAGAPRSLQTHTSPIPIAPSTPSPHLSDLNHKDGNGCVVVRASVACSSAMLSHITMDCCLFVLTKEAGRGTVKKAGEG